MAIIQFRSPVTVPLHPKGQCSPASDDFCVTQQFGDPDFYWSNIPNPPNPLPTHRATDIGNFRCGYPIVAMAPGIATRVQDNATAFGAATDALGVVVDHGQGVRTAYWHLASQTVQTGQVVQAGQEIGQLGSTGLGATCHTHLEMTLNGTKIDPEPYMFGAALDTDNPSGDDMPLPPGRQALVQAEVPTGTGFRRTPEVADNLIRRTDGPTQVVIAYHMPDQGGYTLPDGTKDNDWTACDDGIGAELFYVATPLLGNFRVTIAGRRYLPVAGGFTQEQVDQARQSGITIGFSQGKTKAIAAVEAIEP